MITTLSRWYHQRLIDSLCKRRREWEEEKHPRDPKTGRFIEKPDELQAAEEALRSAEERVKLLRRQQLFEVDIPGEGSGGQPKFQT